MLEPSDVSKNKGTVKCNKNTTICDVGIDPNVTIEPSNVI